MIEGALEAIDFFPDMKGGTWLYFTAALMYDARGNITGAIETLIDITDRKRAEEALHQSEKQFRLLVESSPDVIFVQAEGRFAYVNKAAVEMFGVDGPEDLIGQPVMDRFHPDFRETAREWICLGGREKMSISHLEQTCLRMDGSPVSVEVSAVPVHYDGSDGALVFVRDISERLEGEKTRRALEEQLAQAQKMEAVGCLAGGVAHDLNNLLSPVLGYGEMLIEDFSIEDSRRQSAEEIVAAGYRARDLVRQLLAFSRKQTLEFKVVDANRVIKGLKKLLRRTLREDIQIDLNLACGLPPIQGDVGQLEQIILNLAVNAQDAMPDGGTLTIKRPDIIGRCAGMRYAFDMLAKAAACDAGVLVTGETGTGKELFAKAVHENSSRSHGPFVVVDCAALPETLAESLLFGHEKGAFTGADTPRSGLLKQADGGTLFLDEIGELALSTQKILLRALQERRFRPVGGSREISSRFRLVSATNRDLDKMSEDGSFRNDLLYRLRSIVITLPPLRQRGGDVIDLAMHYMRFYCEHFSIGTKGFSPEFFEMVSQYPWPGNVRELSHAIERAVSLAKDEPTLFCIHLPVHIRTFMARASVNDKEGAASDRGFAGQPQAGFPPIKDVLDAVEKQYLRDLTTVTQWDMERACMVSGLSRSRLYARLKRYGVKRP